MLFPPTALERAMQIRDVLVRAMNKEYSWFRAAEILGVTPRGLRRMRQRMELFGYQGLVDRRRGRPSPRRTPVAELERILQLYRERYSGFNARHFFQTVKREHGVTLSYTCVKQLLQAAGLIHKRRSRGRHRRRRERRARLGELLHLDGSRHAWLALRPEEKQTLIQVVDDATSRLLYAQLWDAETSCAVMTAMRDVVREHGIPEAFYTDRASWAFETPKAGGKVSTTHLTQVGEALARLGVEHIPSYSPQARGRSERTNRTLQDRLVNELKAAGVTTSEGANEYLRSKYIGTHNEEFAQAPSDPTPAFVALGEVDLNEIFFESQTRKVGKDNTVGFDGVVLQIEKQPGRRTCAGLTVQVRRHLDRGHSVRRGAQLLGVYDAQGRPRAIPVALRVHRDTPAPTQAVWVDSRVATSMANHRLTSKPLGVRVPASARLRLPPAGTPSLPTTSKA